MDMVVLPGVLGPHTLRRTVQVRLGSEPLRLSGGTPISKVSLRQFMKHAGYDITRSIVAAVSSASSTTRS